MRKICWEESVHIMHGRDVVVTMVTGSAAQRAAIQDALDRWWGPLMQMHGPRSPREKDRDLHWRIKAKTSEELRQEFLTIYVPRIRELGLVIPDPELRYDEAAGSGSTPNPTGMSCGPSSPTTDRCRRHGSSSGGWPGKRRAGSGNRSWACRPRHEPARRPRAPLPDPVLEAWEVFRQEKDGDPMRHGGSVMAPDAELATHYAREMYGRRQESVRLWVVRRSDVHRPR